MYFDQHLSFSVRLSPIFMRCSVHEDKSKYLPTAPNPDSMFLQSLYESNRNLGTYLFVISTSAQKF